MGFFIRKPNPPARPGVRPAPANTRGAKPTPGVARRSSDDDSTDTDTWFTGSTAADDSDSSDASDD